ncbi:hypothetical protein CK203_063058 [Vitis vinifera]|uniref:Reverse transcriptase zinc-binding domain-containing protein n=1 Tax=Vitis vinifera TaxID=29760 RepID=A0A438G5Z8_VITVI|nr:hypothetical protein CK203_063058 [Vitis vinifera]
MGVWVLEAFLSSIRHFWVNGLGDLRSKGTLFGNRDEFLSLYAIASFKDAWVIDVWDGGSWGLWFIRQFKDWELEEVDALFGRLHNYSIVLGTFDAMVWLETKDGVFSVRSFYSSLASRRVEPFQHSTMWNSWPLLELAFFLGGNLGYLTQDQFKRRGWRMPNRCYMCKAKAETGDHLLLHCSKVSTL